MIVKDGNICRVSGPMTIASSAALLDDARKLLNGDVTSVDLGEVSDVDSSAVSVLLQWIREAKQKNQKIVFSNLPENLKSLASLYGVLEFVSA